MEKKYLKLEDAGNYKVVIKNKVGEKTHQGVLSLSGKLLIWMKLDRVITYILFFRHC